MTQTVHQFRLNFVTDQNALGRITVPRAKHTATAAEISIAMADIIASGALRFVTGDPAFRDSAELVTTERRGIDVW